MCDCESNEREGGMFGLEYSPYSNPDNIGYKGSYSVAGECVGFLTLDDKFLSIARVYGIELNKTAINE